jgi:hydrogenase maturation protein HypF
MLIDTRPLIRAAAADVRQSVSTAIIAQRFHATLVEIITAICHRIRTTTGLHDVVLSGGVFLNALLTTSTMQRLESAGFNAYRHTKVPTNDGGLCLGQLAIAAASL